MEILTSRLFWRDLFKVKLRNSSL